ncbi:Mpr [Roseibium sp. TrichSKD4]|uniref:hypothetical protein n=1 Tax=Roseibium sp. TrichSKD4 TaxID=744980 RepID=UPI0001E576F6|nr:hypothetical protein [Roseibium sp. TrichSKD4]EFO28839.1 Mpr [Roseibium sp. TrichSKD4]
MQNDKYSKDSGNKKTFHHSLSSSSDSNNTGDGLNSNVRSNSLNPTSEIYADFVTAFEHFNAALFDGELSEPVFTLQNKPKMRLSFHENRFANNQDIRAHEIQFNPVICAGQSDYETLGCVVHAMGLQWRYDFGPANAKGVKPSRGYHDKTLAVQMAKIGVRLSDTGESDGKKTGYNLSHYTIEGSPFDLAARDLLITGFSFRWQAIVQKPASDADEDTPNAAPKSRVKYTCEICDLNAWAKADAQLSCTICAIPLSPNFSTQ